ncbi:MAG: ATP-dependent sacrificial sulfur transferase LarE [Deltaproteobacteria bacterium]|nr:ATP-dependent sacrificial sulfur transferase LarE [Deltaproteobacteria bacterium]
MIKLRRLLDIISNYDRIALAYSGGVDSTFLLYVIKVVANKDVVAFTAVSDTYTDEELRFARSFANKHKIKFKTIRTNEFGDKRFLQNTRERCFYCKTELFSKINDLKVRYGLDVIFDGSNYSDRDDFRPGSLARKRFGVISPLELAKMTKEEIVRYSKRLGIDGADRPPNACLASRIPYGVYISKELVRSIAEIERYIKSLGIGVLRLRHHDYIARIETSESDMKKILLNRDRIAKRLKMYGYKYITLDIEGYRMGSLNLL